MNSKKWHELLHDSRIPFQRKRGKILLVSFEIKRLPQKDGIPLSNTHLLESSLLLSRENSLNRLGSAASGDSLLKGWSSRGHPLLSPHPLSARPRF